MVRSAEDVPSEFLCERIGDAPHRIPSDAADEFNTLVVDWLGSR